MKYLRRKNAEQTAKILAALAFVVSSLLFFSDSNFFEIDSDQGKIIGSSPQAANDVRRKSAASFAWQDFEQGSRVYEGDSIYTGPDSTALVTLENGSQITVKENSLVRFLRTDENISLELTYGDIGAKLSGQSTMNVVAGDELIQVDKNQDFELSRGKSGEMRMRRSGLQQTVGPQVRPSMNSQAMQKNPFSIIKPEPNAVATRLLSPKKSIITEASLPLQFGKDSKDRILIEILEQDSTQPGGLIRREYIESTQITSLTLPLKAGSYLLRATNLTNKISPQKAQLNFTIEEQQILTLPRLSWTEQPPSVRPPIPSQLRFAWDNPNRVYARYEVEMRHQEKRLGQVTTVANSIMIPFNEPLAMQVAVRGLMPDGSAGPWLVSRSLLGSHAPPELIAELQPVYEDQPMEVQYRWTQQTAGAALFELQTSDNANFQPTDSQFLTGTTHRQKTTKKQLFARVRSVGNNGEALSDFSNTVISNDLRRIKLSSPKPVRPKDQSTLVVVNTSKPLIRFHWQVSKNEENTFELSLSRTADFSDAQTKKVLGTQLLFREPIQAGTFFWRIRQVNRAGDSSDWSTPQQFSVVPGRRVAGEGE